MLNSGAGRNDIAVTMWILTPWPTPHHPHHTRKNKIGKNKTVFSAARSPSKIFGKPLLLWRRWLWLLKNRTITQTGLIAGTWSTSSYKRTVLIVESQRLPNRIISWQQRLIKYAKLRRVIWSRILAVMVRPTLNPTFHKCLYGTLITYQHLRSVIILRMFVRCFYTDN